MSDFLKKKFLILQNNINEKMDSSDDECGVPLRRVNSGTYPKEWDEVPDNVEFTFKLRLDAMGGKWCKFVYTLKKGTALPYSPVIEGKKFDILNLRNLNFFMLGLKFSFNMQLDPSIAGKKATKSKGTWKFEGRVPHSMNLYEYQFFLKFQMRELMTIV